MKIAVISDIHANHLALQKVIQDIENYGADKIFCLGDLILAGPNPNKTMELLFNLADKYGEDFEIIQGNTDKMIANATDELISKAKEDFPCMGYALEEDVKITDDKYIDFVRNLPEKKQIEIDGVKIELCHGSPRNQSENIYPKLEEKNIEKMIEKSDADLILCGHTHIPCGYSLSSGRMVVNVGSIGRSMTSDKMPVYLQLSFDVCAGFVCNHKTVIYDNLQAQKIILSRGFKKCDELAKMYV